MTSILDFIAKFSDYVKIRNPIISDCARESLQENLRKISVWSERWEMPFNVNKCHIFQLGTRHLKFEYEMSGAKLESVLRVKDLSVTIALNMKFSQDCTGAT